MSRRELTKGAHERVNSARQLETKRIFGEKNGNSVGNVKDNDRIAPKRKRNVMIQNWQSAMKRTKRTKWKTKIRLADCWRCDLNTESTQ